MLPGIVVRSRGDFLQKAAVQRLTLIKVRRECDFINTSLAKTEDRVIAALAKIFHC